MLIYLCGFQIPPEIKQCTSSQQANYYNNTNHSEYLHSLNCLSYIIYRPQTRTNKILQNFLLTLAFQRRHMKPYFYHYKNRWCCGLGVWLERTFKWNHLEVAVYVYKQDLALNDQQSANIYAVKYSQPAINYKSVNIDIQRTLFPNL